MTIIKILNDITQWIRSFGQFIYNRQDHRILGRDGKRWSKLAAFYFFFYVTLGGLFCLYLAVFMSFLPLNQPRYVGKDSQITSRGHPLSPGLSFRPQISSNLHDVQTLISLSTNHGKGASSDSIEIYTKSLDDFLHSYYSTSNTKNFTMVDVNDCKSDKQYGFTDGKPCILIKMNKLVGFVPEIGRTDADSKEEEACTNVSNIPVQCTGEYPFDRDMLGDIMYYSESGSSDVCGSIDVKHFPYPGQNNVYQVPYVWVQFLNISAHVLISVECRVFGANLFYDKQAQRASIRFQLYLNKNFSI